MKAIINDLRTLDRRKFAEVRATKSTSEEKLLVGIPDDMVNDVALVTRILDGTLDRNELCDLLWESEYRYIGEVISIEPYSTRDDDEVIMVDTNMLAPFRLISGFLTIGGNKILELNGVSIYNVRSSDDGNVIPGVYSLDEFPHVDGTFRVSRLPNYNPKNSDRKNLTEAIEMNMVYHYSSMFIGVNRGFKPILTVKGSTSVSDLKTAIIDALKNSCICLSDRRLSTAIDESIRPWQNNARESIYNIIRDINGLFDEALMKYKFLKIPDIDTPDGGDTIEISVLDCDYKYATIFHSKTMLGSAIVNDKEAVVCDLKVILRDAGFDYVSDDNLRNLYDKYVGDGYMTTHDVSKIFHDLSESNLKSSVKIVPKFHKHGGVVIRYTSYNKS